MRISLRSIRPLVATFILAAVIGLAGCADSMIGHEDTAQVDSPLYSKLRHAHLLGSSDEAGKLMARYEELITHTEFVLGVVDTVLRINRVVARYENHPTLSVKVKRKFKKSVKAIAVHVHPDDVAEFLKEVDADDDIAWAEPDPKIKGNTGRTDKNMGKGQDMPANLELIGLGKGKAKDKFEFKNVEIYILDTGVDNDDLNIVETRDFVADTTGDSSLEDFGLGILSDDARDADGHGTHIAGIAAAIDDDDGLIGVAAGAPIHDFRVLDENGEADFSTVIAAVELITKRKLDDPSTPIVVNISFGADVGTSAYNGLDEAIEASIDAGVVYVIAAGNDDVDAAHVTPAHVAEAITVGSVNKKKRFSSFSNYGSLIDIFAPGEDIESLSPDHNKILIMTGTSMAAPHVTGAAALYLEFNPKDSPEEVRDELVDMGEKAVKKAPGGTTKIMLSLLKLLKDM